MSRDEWTPVSSRVTATVIIGCLLPWAILIFILVLS